MEGNGSNRDDQNYPDYGMDARKVFISFLNMPIDCEVLILEGMVFQRQIPVKWAVCLP